MKFFLCFLLLVFPLFSPPASCIPNGESRIIAIMENERLIRAEPNITLASFFRSADASTRRRAVLAAGRIGNKALLGELIPLAQDEDAQVRANVAFALGQIRAKNCIPPALTLMKDGDARVRRFAIEALGRIGGLEVSRYLTPLLNDSHVEIRVQAALALALIKDKGTVDLLMRKTSADDAAQWAYIYALYRLADERSVPALHQVLSRPVASPSTGEPSSLLFALKALWSMKKPLSAEEIDRLLQHKDARVQQNALDVIAASADKNACLAIDKYFTRMSVHSQWKAIDAAGAAGCDALVKKSLEAKNTTLHGAALVTFAKLRKDEAALSLQQAARDPSWVIRWRVAQGAANLSKDKAGTILTSLLKDRETAVRLAALESQAGHLPATSDSLMSYLKSEDFAIRATVADALGKTKDPRFLPLLLKTYQESDAATEVEGRIAVLDVLAEYNTSEVIDVYVKALQDPQYTIRQHAIDGLKKIVGTEFYWNGKIIRPDDFLFNSAAVSLQTQAKYAADFGSSQPDIVIEMRLEKGTVVIRLLGSEAPLHVANFLKHARSGLYNGLRIHRVVPNFVIQGGDPRGDGWGGAGEVLVDQFNTRVYNRGVVGMPTAGKDTGGCQFFITHSRQPHLDGNYTVFGEVISGMQFVDTTEIGDRIQKVSIRPSSKSPTTLLNNNNGHSHTEPE